MPQKSARAYTCLRHEDICTDGTHSHNHPTVSVLLARTHGSRSVKLVYCLVSSIPGQTGRFSSTSIQTVRREILVELGLEMVRGQVDKVHRLQQRGRETGDLHLFLHHLFQRQRVVHVAVVEELAEVRIRVGGGTSVAVVVGPAVSGTHGIQDVRELDLSLWRSRRPPLTKIISFAREWISTFFRRLELHGACPIWNDDPGRIFRYRLKYWKIGRRSISRRRGFQDNSFSRPPIPPTWTLWLGFETNWLAITS